MFLGVGLVTTARAAEPTPAAPAAAAPATAPKIALALGVAEFERVPPAGAGVPDVGALLADRLVTLGVERVVGPTRLQAPASAEPTDDEVKGWAGRSRVAAIVVGRTTRVGTTLTIDTRLRSGSQGAPVGTYTAEVARPEDLVVAVESLADQILAEGVPALAGAAPRSDVAAPAPTPGKGPLSSLTPGSALPIDVGGLKKDAPLDIQSDELEAFSNEKSKRFLFTGNVRVSQDVMSLKADRLEAFYPPNSNEPDRLVATGRVLVSQRDQEARCDVATYLKAEQRIFCRGNAEMKQGEDRVRGKEIEIRLDTDQLIVRGGAEVHIQPKPKKQPAAPGGGQG
jgi:lipopolysaccharide export system protein LptA